MSPNEVLWNTAAVPVHEAETELGSRVALFGCPCVPNGCLGEVLWRAHASIVGKPELVLGLWITAFSIPAQGVGAVLLIACSGPDEFAMLVADCAVNLRRGSETAL